VRIGCIYLEKEGDIQLTFPSESRFLGCIYLEKEGDIQRGDIQQAGLPFPCVSTNKKNKKNEA